MVDWAARYMLRPGSELANPEDMAIPRCVKTADEAIAILKTQHACWWESRADSSPDLSVNDPAP